jgi:hypothetical protein
VGWARPWASATLNLACLVRGKGQGQGQGQGQG